MTLARLIRDSRGAIGLLGAGGITATLAALAFAVDLGSLYMESRRLQGIADAAALAAVSDPPNAQAAASRAVEAAGWDRQIDLTVDRGDYNADPSLPVASRFTRSGSGEAAHVVAASDGRVFFGILALGRNSTRISKSATATRANLASFSIGSRLAALDGGVANALLSALTGSQVRLSVMEYQALAAADVELFSMAEALQTQLDLQAASFDRALDAEMSTPAVLRLIAASLEASGSAAAASAVRQIATAAASAAPVKLSKLIDLGAIGAQDRAAPGQAVRVNAADLVRAVISLANGSRQVQADLGASVPGLAGTTVQLSIGDRVADSPWITVTDRGEPVIRTSQTRLRIETTVGGAPALGIATIRVPLYLELAEAEAKLDAIDCAGRQSRSLSLLVRPSIGHASLADTSPSDISNHRVAVSEGPARLVSLPLISVTGRSRVDLAGGGWQRVTFTSGEIATRSSRTVSSNSVVQGLAASLVQRTNLTVNLAGLGLNLSAITTAVGTALQLAAPALDSLIDSLTGLLGIHLGQADVRINGVRCGMPALVA